MLAFPYPYNVYMVYYAHFIRSPTHILTHTHTHTHRAWLTPRQTVGGGKKRKNSIYLCSILFFFVISLPKIYSLNGLCFLILFNINGRWHSFRFRWHSYFKIKRLWMAHWHFSVNDVHILQVTFSISEI